MTCKNCSNEVNLNYCSNCGQPATLKRIDSHYIRHEIEHLLHFEKGIIYAVKELVVRPGDNIRADLFDRRKNINYLKALSAYILGMISFFTIVTIIGNSVDLIVFY